MQTYEGAAGSCQNSIYVSQCIFISSNHFNFDLPFHFVTWHWCVISCIKLWKIIVRAYGERGGVAPIQSCSVK